MQRRLLIWYRPGMISLLLLPVLCLLFLREKGAFKEYNLMRVYRITKEFYKPPKSSGIIYVRPPERQDLEILFDGNGIRAKANLDTAQLFLHQLISECDTFKGIHFKFTEQAKYWMFVRALDICKIEKAQHFVTLENDVRAYYQESEVVDSSQIWAPFPFCDVILNIEVFEQTERQAKRSTYLANLRGFWLLSLAFSVLVVLTLLPDHKNTADQ